jgi:DNA-binding CsgD family transcriptional regulator
MRNFSGAGGQTDAARQRQPEKDDAHIGWHNGGHGEEGSALVRRGRGRAAAVRGADGAHRRGPRARRRGRVLRHQVRAVLVRAPERSPGRPGAGGRRRGGDGDLHDAAIAARLFLSEGAISKYTTTIFAKLGLAADDDTNRRVRAVLAYLGADSQPGPAATR